MSPFTHADKITKPLLLIHGEADNNTGARARAPLAAAQSLPQAVVLGGLLGCSCQSHWAPALDLCSVSLRHPRPTTAPRAGTFPMQSERFYQALKGHGGTARLVLLPHESHGYSARESIMHVRWRRLRGAAGGASKGRLAWPRLAALVLCCLRRSMPPCTAAGVAHPTPHHTTPHPPARPQMLWETDRWLSMWVEGAPPSSSEDEA